VALDGGLDRGGGGGERGDQALLRRELRATGGIGRDGFGETNAPQLAPDIVDGLLVRPLV